MYYICKTVSENWVEPDIDDQKQQGSASFHYLKNWHEIKAVLDLLAPISSLNDEVNQIKGCLPSQGEFTGPTCMFPTGVRNTFTQKMSNLRLKVETIEGVLRNNYNHDLVGIDIKLPHNMNLADMGRYIRDLDFILQCPLFVLDNTRIEVSSVDRGSIWINIGIVGTMVDFFVNRLAEIVDKILVIRSHYLTSKEQEARLRQLELKTEVLEDVVSGFELAHKKEMENLAAEMSEKYDITNPEDRVRVDEATKRLFELCNKGLEIYQAINPGVTTPVFPSVEKQRLSESAIKMLAEETETE